MASRNWRNRPRVPTILFVGDHREPRRMDRKGVYAPATACLPAGTARWFRAITAAALVSSMPSPAPGGVLDENDLARIARIKPSFIEVVTDISQSAQRPDLPRVDGECIKAVLQGLMQISEELRTYENLITIEGELNDFGDDRTLRSVVRFAVDNALKVLENERRRLSELSEQCSRSPLSASKARQTMQFLEGTVAILRSLQPRL
jgi:hypothetical protein